MTELPAWITDDALAPVWERVRGRFEQAGLRPDGQVSVALTSREQRRAVGDLLARTVTRDRVSIDLAVLDARLRARSGAGGLAEVLTRLGGRAPRDRPGLRAARDEARERPLALAAELVPASWSSEWVAGLRRVGLLTGREGADDIVRAAATVLRALTGPGDEPGDSAAGDSAGGPRRAQSRVELGARLLGDAHALDEDRPVNHVVLRGLAAASGCPVPQSARAREALWAAFSVEPDLLSRTCLVRNVVATADTSIGQRLALAAESGDPVHLTEWDLRRVGLLRPVTENRVLVCENPRVLEAIADARLPGWSVVCTSGERNLVVDRVLAGLAEAGVALLYHGDFDWPGVALANRAMHRYAVTPWLMRASDYVQALLPGAPALEGAPIEPAWDHELGAAMRNHGRAVHEESVLPQLIEVVGADSS